MCVEWCCANYDGFYEGAHPFTKHHSTISSFYVAEPSESVKSEEFARFVVSFDFGFSELVCFARVRCLEY